MGAREHYSIPRSLHQAGLLSLLITDAWVRPGHPLGWVAPRRLQERYHADLAQAQVQSWSWESAVRCQCQWSRYPRWQRFMSQNAWFANKAAASVGSIARRSGSRPILFSYCYTAGPLFRIARANGWTTVLGQIDGGLVEAQLVKELHQASPSAGSAWAPPPNAYWGRWQEELDSADVVLVNSSWSKQCLVNSTYVEPRRIVEVPLAYDPPPDCLEYQRTYPSVFSAERRMRVLFLGQVTVRKGILPLFEAIRLLKGLPVEFWFVGPVAVRIPSDISSHPQVRFVGAVARSEVSAYYRDAHVFVFPTYSDGFGLTQLEAQAWKLPIIASPYCGEVVANNRNGIVLDAVDAEILAVALRRCLAAPGMLEHFSQNAANMDAFSLANLRRRLMSATQPSRLL